MEKGKKVGKLIKLDSFDADKRRELRDRAWEKKFKKCVREILDTNEFYADKDEILDFFIEIFNKQEQESFESYEAKIIDTLKVLDENFRDKNFRLFPMEDQFRLIARVNDKMAELIEEQKSNSEGKVINFENN